MGMAVNSRSWWLSSISKCFNREQDGSCFEPLWFNACLISPGNSKNGISKAPTWFGGHFEIKFLKWKLQIVKLSEPCCIAREKKTGVRESTMFQSPTFHWVKPKPERLPHCPSADGHVVAVAVTNVWQVSLQDPQKCVGPKQQLELFKGGPPLSLPLAAGSHVGEAESCSTNSSGLSGSSHEIVAPPLQGGRETDSRCSRAGNGYG